VKLDEVGEVLIKKIIIGSKVSNKIELVLLTIK